MPHLDYDNRGDEVEKPSPCKDCKLYKAVLLNKESNFYLPF